MIQKLFILGNPGGGKSTAARHIKQIAERERERVNVTYTGDYPILFEMYRKDISDMTEMHPKKFRPAIPDKPRLGFDVLDFSVLDTALQTLEEQTSERMKNHDPKKGDELIIPEIARDDYGEMLQNKFSREFLQNSYFLFVDADVETCIGRVHQRVASGSEDTHFISDEIMRSYYGKDDNRSYMANDFRKEFGLREQRVKILINEGSQESFLEEVGGFTERSLLSSCHENGLTPFARR